MLTRKLLLVLSICLGSVMAAQNSFKLKFSTELLTHMIHMNDQEILHSFQDLRISYRAARATIQREVVMKGPDDRCPELDIAIYSIVPNEGIDFESWNLDVSYNDREKGYLGVESKDLRVIGELTLNQTETLSFTAPIEAFKLEIDIVPDTNEEFIAVNRKAVMPIVKEFKFEVG